MKKVLSAILAGAMVASIASVAAFAAEHTGTLSATSVVDDDNTDGDCSTAVSGEHSAWASNAMDSVSNKTYYYIIPTINGVDPSVLADDDYFSFKYKKDEGAKMVKSISLVNKKLNGSRQDVVKVELKEDFSDTETKVKFTVYFNAKGKVENDGSPVKGKVNSGDRYYLEQQTIYVKNYVNDGDYDYSNGKSGWVSKPTKDDDNEVTWENANETVARLKFYGDSDVNKYYPKLSTMWPNEDYATYFKDRDAYLFDFVSNPTISSTSRATLEIYNPFINDDDEETVDAENIRILTIGDSATLASSTDEMLAAIDDGRLVDITSSFTYGENDDGDMVFTTKTRTLGTYIIVDMTNVDEVSSDIDVPVDDNEAPVADTKVPPITGNF